MSEFIQQIIATPLLEWVAVVLALAYVWLAAKENSWCWACAFVSTAIYTYLFWQVALPFQSVLNFYYMIMAVYGYWQWGKSAQNAHNAISSWPISWHIALVPTLLAVGFGLAELASSQFNNEYLWLDATINVFSIVTTVMVAHKILQNWLYWVAINSASAWLYAQSGMTLSACLFAAYVMFAVYGYREWYQQWKCHNARNSSD